MNFEHVPVLLEECIDSLDIRHDGTYVDGTVGGAGHASHICGKLSEAGTFIGIDKDTDALKTAEERLAGYNCDKYLRHGSFADIKDLIRGSGKEKIDGALLDIGVSSYQLDTPERGFSYMHDAPLDMRMDRSYGKTAYDVINEYSENELKEIISGYGEERWASRIASFIVKRRKENRIETTLQLADLIKAAIPAKARREGPHPAKRTFQAIRIEVNEELEELKRAVDEYLDILTSGGKLCIITFHSLEDRIVKESFRRRANPCTCPPEFPVCVCGKKGDVRLITGKPIIAGEKELENNPRARSAKLRVCEKV